MVAMKSARRHLKYGVIRMGLETIALSGVSSLFPAAAGRGMIFTLHHVRPEISGGGFAPNAILSVTPEFLETAVLTALERGMIPVHLHDLPARLADKADRRKFVAFTLDDGYRNNAAFAAPIFRKHGIPYTIFITAGFVERTRALWWETAEALVRNAVSFRFDFGSGTETVDAGTTNSKFAAFDRLATFVQAIDEDEVVERIDKTALAHAVDPMAIVRNLVMDAAELRDLARDPLVHFGAHTLTHVNLKRVTPDRLRDEIRGSTEAVERYVGKRPLSFSYPYGWSSAAGEREAEATSNAGFSAAVTTQPGILNQACLERPTLLPRVSLNGLYQKRRYVDALLSGLPFRFM